MGDRRTIPTRRGEPPKGYRRRADMGLRSDRRSPHDRRQTIAVAYGILWPDDMTREPGSRIIYVEGDRVVGSSLMLRRSGNDRRVGGDRRA